MIKNGGGSKKNSLKPTTLKKIDVITKFNLTTIFIFAKLCNFLCPSINFKHFRLMMKTQ